jgi:hypothetical protein
MSVRQRVKELPMDEIIRLYCVEQWSTVKLAERFGVADVTLSALLKRHGITIRGICGPRPRSRKARASLNEGLMIATYNALNDVGMSELARSFKTSLSTVKTILLDNGVALKPHSEIRHRGRLKGQKNPNYNPELTADERDRMRPKVQTANWRLAVFRRDAFECQSCFAFNKRETRLEAHHVESWSTCRERRFDISNGITLCRKCHIEFHRKFGLKHNTRVQLAEFLCPAMEIAA